MPGMGGSAVWSGREGYGIDLPWHPALSCWLAMADRLH